MKHLTKLFTLLIMAAMSMGVRAVSLPMNLGSYMPAADAVLSEGNNISTSGTYGFHSIHSGATATFTLSNCEENMLLTFMTGTSENRTPQVTVTMTDGGSFNYTTGAVDITNTGGYNLSTHHNYAISNIPSGTITLTFSFSAEGGYVCNLGNIGLYGASQYDQIPSENAIDIEQGTHFGGARYESGNNIGNIRNGSYSIYNVYVNESVFGDPGTVYMDMRLNINWFKSASTIRVSIYDIDDLSTPEIAPSEYAVSGTEADKICVIANSITPGFKQIRLDYLSESADYLFNYKNLRFVERDDPADDDPSAATFGLTRSVANETSTAPDASSKYLTSNATILDPSVGITITKQYGDQQGSGWIAENNAHYLDWRDGETWKSCYIPYTSDPNNANKYNLKYRTQFNNAGITSFNENVYFGYRMEVPAGYRISLVRLISDVLRENNHGLNGLQYQVKIYNNGTCVKTLEHVISSTPDMRRNTNLSREDALQNMTGTIEVKMHYWNGDSYARHMDVKDLRVKAVVHSITSQTKTLKAIEVNGVDYDYATLGNSIDALYHAAPEVKFYYDVKNNWSDGSQTDAADENETIVASVSGDDYVAATTLASTPYSLTFTNIDLAKVFGIKRTVADETSISSDEIVTAKRVSDDILVDPSVTGVTISKSYGLQSVMQDKSRAIKWFDGTAQQDCYIDKLDKNYRTQFEKGVVPESAEAAVSITSLDERCYYSFDLAVDLGYKLSLQALNSDVLKEMYGTHYQVKIYNNGELLKTLEDVGSATTEADMKRHFDLSEEAVLQELSGTVTVKMFVWNTEATKYVNIKDFTVEALVEKKAGEGVEGLVFTDFTPAPQPVFTEGEVTAVWSRNIGGNISPDVKNEVKRGIRMQTGYDYTMRLSVPSDSYISEVVFVWNKNGNKTAEVNPDYFLDLSIRNSSNVEVSTLQYGGAKVDETTWSCGDVRESELKFVQGAGDFYCHSIRVTYLHKVAGSYHRTHPHMNLNTLCYPYQIDSYTGATFYTMLYKVVESTEVTEVVLQEHVGALEAGKPYFYVPEGTELVCNYSGDYTAAGNDGNGVYGSYTNLADVANGMYVTYNNQIVKAGDNVQLREYRAYINMDEVSLQSGANLVPGRRQLRIASAPQQTTGIESQELKANSQKLIKNGQLFIIRDGKTYDIFGRLVD